MSISCLNPIFDLLLESSHRDDFNKMSNIGFGQEIMELASIKVYFTHVIWSSVNSSLFSVFTVWKYYSLLWYLFKLMKFYVVFIVCFSGFTVMLVSHLLRRPVWSVPDAYFDIYYLPKFLLFSDEQSHIFFISNDKWTERKYLEHKELNGGLNRSQMRFIQITGQS